jgi:hypothetical protein
MAWESLDFDDDIKFRIVDEDYGRGAIGLRIQIDEPEVQKDDEDLGINFGTLRIRND